MRTLVIDRATEACSVAVFDGDALVAVATGTVDAPVDLVRLLAVAAVERAVRSVAVRHDA